MRKADGYDDVKQKFEKAYPELNVKIVVDYNDKYVVVGCERKDGVMMIPGHTYKVDKKTGESSFFSPMEDLTGFSKAMKERSRKYK